MKLPSFLKAKIAAPDTVRVMWIWTIVGLGGFWRTFTHGYMPEMNGYDIKGNVLGRDFMNPWLGAKMTLEGKLADVYSLTGYMAEVRSLFGMDAPKLNFSYPPHILPLILVLGLLPYFVALAVWSCGGLAAITATLRKNGAAALGWSGLLLVAISPASIINLFSGQNGAFTAALFLGGLYLCESSPLVAGVLFGLLTVKPHLGVLIVPVLLMRRNWKCIGAACATAGALLAVSVAIWGIAPWHDFFTITVPYQKRLLELRQGFYPKMMPGFWSDAIVVMNMDRTLAGVITAILSLAAGALALFAVWREGITAATVLLLALATMIILPYSFNYDMVAIAGAMVVYLASEKEVPVPLHLLFGLLWALPLSIVEMKGLPVFPASSFVLVASFIGLWLLQAHKRTAAR